MDSKNERNLKNYGDLTGFLGASAVDYVERGFVLTACCRKGQSLVSAEGLDEKSMDYLIEEVAELSEKQKEEIWNLLKAADREFVPPLSERRDTTQEALAPGAASEGTPRAYFEKMLTQRFLCVSEKKKVIGFMTYIPEHTLELSDGDVVCEYISTIVVDKNYRNQGITALMYQKMMEKHKRLGTRTWSLNDAHLHLLKKMGFSCVNTIPNDRGEGIDTVYYVWEDEQYEKGEEGKK